MMNDMDGIEITKLEAELAMVRHEMCLAKSELEEETAICKDFDEYLAEEGTRMRPFEIDLWNYVILQGNDVFTEKWEQKLAISSMKEALYFGNEGYSVQKAEYDRIKSERNKHLMNVRILRESIVCKHNHIKRLRERISELSNKTDV